MDSIGPYSPDLQGNTHALVMIDDHTRKSWFEPRPDVTSATTVKLMQDIFRRKQPEIDRTDGGPEFQDEFKRYLREQKTEHEKSRPHEPQTNARIESHNGNLIRGIASYLARAKAPGTWSGLAGHSWNFDWNHMRTGVDGKTPFEREHGIKWHGNPIPFGAKIIYRDPNPDHRKRDKFAPSGTVGIFAGYSENPAGMTVIPWDYLRETGRVQTTVVGQVHQPNPPHWEFPMGEITGRDKAAWIVAGKDVVTAIQTCNSCRLPRMGTAPLTCRPCLNTKRKRGHDRTEGCRHGRCSCDIEEDEDDIIFRPNTSTMTDTAAWFGTPDTPTPGHTSGETFQINTPNASPDDGPVDGPDHPCPDDGPDDPHHIGIVAPVEGATTNDGQTTPDATIAPVSDWNDERERDDRSRTSGQDHAQSADDPARPMAWGINSVAFYNVNDDEVTNVACHNDNMAMITQLIDPRAPEYQCEGAQQAIRDEVRKFVYDNKVIQIKNPRSWTHDVKRNVKDATRVKNKIQCAVKHAERRGEEKYKGRAYLQGCLQRNSDDKLVKLDRSQEAYVIDPMRHEEIRLIDGWTFYTYGARGNITMGDQKSAYLNTPLKGPPVFVHLTEEIFSHLERADQEAIRRIQKRYGVPLSDIVFQADNAGYGLERSGFDHDEDRTKKLLSIDFELIDGRKSLYRAKLFGEDWRLGVYVDDFRLGGPRDKEMKVWNLINSVLPLQDGYGLNKQGRLCMGIETHIHRIDQDTVHVFYNQTKYAKHIVERFESDYNMTLKPASAPITKNHGLTKQEAKEAGEWADDACSLVMSLAYLCRTRIDILTAIRLMQRCVSPGKWTRECDDTIVRTMRYVAGTTEHGVNNIFVKGDRLQMDLWSDSDLGGDKNTRRSTSGDVLMLAGEYGTSALIGEVCRLQTAEATASAESECVAHVTGVKRLVLPALKVVKDIITNGVKYKIDASAAIAAITNGYSRELDHMSLTQGINVGWANTALHALREDMKDHGGAELVKVGTKEQLGDFLTKILEAQALIPLVRRCGVGPEAKHFPKHTEQHLAYGCQLLDDHQHEPHEMPRVIPPRTVIRLNQQEAAQHPGSVPVTKPLPSSCVDEHVWFEPGAAMESTLGTISLDHHAKVEIIIKTGTTGHEQATMSCNLPPGTYAINGKITQSTSATSARALPKPKERPRATTTRSRGDEPSPANKSSKTWWSGGDEPSPRTQHNSTCSYYNGRPGSCRWSRDWRTDDYGCPFLHDEPSGPSKRDERSGPSKRDERKHTEDESGGDEPPTARDERDERVRDERTPQPRRIELEPAHTEDESGGDEPPVRDERTPQHRRMKDKKNKKDRRAESATSSHERDRDDRRKRRRDHDHDHDRDRDDRSRRT
jgi:hypothetical protein